MADQAKRTNERVVVVSPAPYRFRLFSSRPVEPKTEVPFAPVHRPPLKYSPEQRLAPLLSNGFFTGYACGFLYYSAEVFYKVYGDRRHYLYRDNPSLKHFRYCLAGSVLIGLSGGLPFALQCSVMRGTEFGLEQWRGVRDIYNLAVAGGLSFGALHLFSVENLVATSKKQPRFVGRLPLMVAVGAAIGGFAHAAEFSFFDTSTIFRKNVFKLGNLPEESSQGSTDHVGLDPKNSTD